jgi:hypothetical protein
MSAIQSRSTALSVSPCARLWCNGRSRRESALATNLSRRRQKQVTLAHAALHLLPDHLPATLI